MQRMWRDDLKKGIGPLGFLAFASRPYRLSMVFALIAVAIAAILNSGSAYAFKMLVDAATVLAVNGSARELWIAGIVLVSLSLGGTLMWRLSGFIGMRWATGVRATGRYALSSYVTRHGHEYFSNRFAGSVSSKITHAANSIKEMSEQVMWQFTHFVVAIASSLVVVFLANPLLGYVFVFWIALLVPLNIFLARRRIPYSSATQKTETALTGATVDLLTNMSAVHEYANRGQELVSLKDLIINRRKTGLRNWRYGEWVLLLNGICMVVFTGVMIFIAIYLATRGIVSPGDIALILTLVFMIEDRLTFIGQQLNNFADAWGQVTESLEDILIDHDVPDAANAVPLNTSSGSVHVDTVSFSYAGKEVFSNLTIEIPAGQRVGLVGRSGAGKSTLMKILLRHYDLSNGHVRIGDTDIAKVTKESLRKAIAVVPQEPLLFHRTIRENIRYGKPDASEEEVIHAAKLAQAHEFITSLPEGYDALVGERGVKLSGGQRQRIVIARALLKNAPILLLDEATSSLDSESEAAVQEALLELMKNRTVIAIAHRLSTLRAMDRLIVMDQGKIIEDGTHEELIAHGGLYAELWSHQAGGFLED